MAAKQDPRVRLLLNGIPRSKRKQANSLAEHAIAIEDKLRDTREKIWGMDVVIPYDNGGGQKGLRENPAYRAYASLLSSYQKVLNQLDGLNEEDKSASMFDWNR